MDECRGSRLHEAAAAGCAVVTGSCSGMFMEVADLNQAALRAAEEWDLTAESPMSTSGQEEPRCQNPTPRRAAGYAVSDATFSARMVFNPFDAVCLSVCSGHCLPIHACLAQQCSSVGIIGDIARKVTLLLFQYTKVVFETRTSPLHVAINEITSVARLPYR